MRIESTSQMPADFKHAARALVRFAPPIASVSVAIGLSIAVLELIWTVVIQPFPYRSQNDLIVITESSRTGSLAPSYPTYVELKRRLGSLDDLAARNFETFNVVGVDAAEQVRGSNVSANLLAVLGVGLLKGQGFTAADDESGAPTKVVISYSFWRGWFVGADDVIGQSLSIDGLPAEVVGVLPETFRFPIDEDRGDILMSLARIRRDIDKPGVRAGLMLTARMNTGRPVAAVKSELQSVVSNLAAVDQSSSGQPTKLQAAKYVEVVLAPLYPIMVALWAAALCLFVIATANAASLLLQQSIKRSDEFAVRQALGATPGHILRLFVADGVLLVVVNAALGVQIAWLLMAAGKIVAPPDLPRAASLGLTPRSFVAAVVLAALSVSAGLIVPWWRARRGAVLPALKHSPQVGTAAGRSVIGIQVALTLVLLIGASLLVVTVRRLTAVRTGFDASGVVAATYYLPDATYKPLTRISQFHQRLIDSATTFPNVASVGTMSPLPFGQGRRRAQYTVVGAPSPPIGVDELLVTPGIKDALGLVAKDGRFFDVSETNTGVERVLVDSIFADQYLAGRGAIGARIQRANVTEPWEVVGVVEHIKMRSLAEEPQPQVYRSLLGLPQHFATVVVKASGGRHADVYTALRKASHDIDPAVALYDVHPLFEIVARTILRQRFAASLFSAFGACALLLAALGVGSTTASFIVDRRRELALRSALGASPAKLVWEVSKALVVPTLVGVVAGLTASAFMVQTLASLLFSVRPMSPAVFSLTPLRVCMLGTVFWL